MIQPGAPFRLVPEGMCLLRPQHPPTIRNSRHLDRLERLRQTPGGRHPGVSGLGRTAGEACMDGGQLISLVFSSPRSRSWSHLSIVATHSYRGPCGYASQSRSEVLIGPSRHEIEHLAVRSCESSGMMLAQGVRGHGMSWVSHFK